jgi:hypothetical protein
MAASARAGGGERAMLAVGGIEQTFKVKGFKITEGGERALGYER